ncbi:MAG: hypothetical protein HYZ28_08440 [Myxococcales bacterium]|nr:hypothetical protein [Myxococcales bacterium]
MDARRLLKRVESARHSKETLRSVGRDIGHELAFRNLPVIRELSAGLALQGGEALEPWLAGYRAALVDLLAACDAELSERERETDLERLVAERQHWAAVLRELAKGPSTPSELREAIGIQDSGQMSRLLAEVRAAGLAEVRVLERGDSRTRPHQLTLLGERIVEKLPAGQPDEEQLEAYRMASSVFARIICERHAEPAALAHAAQIALGGKSGVDPRAAAEALLKEATKAGVVLATDEGYQQPDYAVPSIVLSLLEKRDPSELWDSLTRGLTSEDTTFLVRASNETESAWKHFIVRRNVPRARVLDFGDMGSGFEPPLGRVVLVYDTRSLRAQDYSAHPESVRALEQYAVSRKCITTEPNLVPEGYEPFTVDLAGSIAGDDGGHHAH